MIFQDAPREATLGPQNNVIWLAGVAAAAAAATTNATATVEPPPPPPTTPAEPPSNSENFARCGGGGQQQRGSNETLAASGGGDAGGHAAISIGAGRRFQRAVHVRRKDNREPFSITLDLLRSKSKGFSLDITETAREVGVCATVMKRACRSLGLINGWPFRVWKRCNYLRDAYLKDAIRMVSEAAALEQQFALSPQHAAKAAEMRSEAARLRARVEEVDPHGGRVWWRTRWAGSSKEIRFSLIMSYGGPKAPIVPPPSATAQLLQLSASAPCMPRNQSDHLSRDLVQAQNLNIVAQLDAVRHQIGTADSVLSATIAAAAAAVTNGNCGGGGSGFRRQRSRSITILGETLQDCRHHQTTEIVPVVQAGGGSGSGSAAVAEPTAPSGPRTHAWALLGPTSGGDGDDGVLAAAVRGHAGNAVPQFPEQGSIPSLNELADVAAASAADGTQPLPLRGSGSGGGNGGAGGNGGGDHAAPSAMSAAAAAVQRTIASLPHSPYHAMSSLPAVAFASPARTAWLPRVPGGGGGGGGSSGADVLAVFSTAEGEPLRRRQPLNSSPSAPSSPPSPRDRTQPAAAPQALQQQVAPFRLSRESALSSLDAAAAAVAAVPSPPPSPLSPQHPRDQAHMSTRLIRTVHAASGYADRMRVHATGAGAAAATVAAAAAAAGGCPGLSPRLPEPLILQLQHGAQQQQQQQRIGLAAATATAYLRKQQADSAAAAAAAAPSSPSPSPPVLQDFDTVPFTQQPQGHGAAAAAAASASPFRPYVPLTPRSSVLLPLMPQPRLQPQRHQQQRQSSAIQMTQRAPGVAGPQARSPPRHALPSPPPPQQQHASAAAAANAAGGGCNSSSPKTSPALGAGASSPPKPAAVAAPHAASAGGSAGGGGGALSSILQELQPLLPAEVADLAAQLRESRHQVQLLELRVLVAEQKAQVTELKLQMAEQQRTAAGCAMRDVQVDGSQERSCRNGRASFHITRLREI
ncbi:hypothetical protein VOLCADRAFT_92128 [Volvox carteri f. nagariensis]|uniref:RWP-RK domain-containing protein n=1 Tax=Volvox carteri f. nagariensis TaxID=3068 RepID=D8TYN9_VOLCA|nr:uncharacterized protein VOLCADRAFT_92128 [Volvox carteri f. nagariensis]EFJ47346.1 hypothetical protein VOLCADRAFT_92128 [Volvox carteri f. nagariensis]|eukprot:XP_002951535.1 hypothetical protein VOLCADRAFT_92128 [Volvox carteri f. nagariensis]